MDCSCVLCPLAMSRCPPDVCEGVRAIRKVILQCMVRLLSGLETADHLSISVRTRYDFSFRAIGDGVGLAVV